MCRHNQLEFEFKELIDRFDAGIDNPDQLIFGDVNAHAYLATPIILDKDPKKIVTNHHWGLIPHWAKDNTIRKNTVNAVLETLEEKPSFRNVVNKRCLIVSTGFYEWRWLDEKGKSKQKYSIHLQENKIFTIAGIYSTWQNPENGELVNSYAMVTTEANDTMRYVHNTKNRMPVVLRQEDEMKWLDSNVDHMKFAYPNYSSSLIALPVN